MIEEQRKRHLRKVSSISVSSVSKRDAPAYCGSSASIRETPMYVYIGNSASSLDTTVIRRSPSSNVNIPTYGGSSCSNVDTHSYCRNSASILDTPAYSKTSAKNLHAQAYCGSSASIVDTPANGGSSSNNLDTGGFSGSFDKPLSEEMMPLVSRLGLPLTAVKAIAQKVEEIFKTNCAIVEAPGHCKEARMVLSSSGKRCHLAVPNKWRNVMR